jgi:hypothetical protein
MSALGKRLPALLALVLLVGAAVHFWLKADLEKRIAADAAARRALIVGLQGQSRLQKSMTPAAAPAAEPLPVAAPASTPVQRMNAATELLKSGLFGPFAWTRPQGSTVAEELAALADALGLSDGQKSALQAAAEKAQQEVVAAVLAGAKVQFNPNTERGAAETREEAAERSRLMQNASPAEMVALMAQQLSKQSASRGEQEVAIELPESPAARAAFAAMQATFAGIMGADNYSFYQGVGAAAVIENMFNELGLQPHRLSLVSRPAGTISAVEERLQEMQAKTREAAIGAGRPAPPDIRMPQPAPDGSGRVYEFHRITWLATWQESITRTNGRGGMGAGGGGNNALSAIISSRGVSGGSSSAITQQALRNAMGPLQSLIPVGF